MRWSHEWWGVVWICYICFVWIQCCMWEGYNCCQMLSFALSFCSDALFCAENTAAVNSASLISAFQVHLTLFLPILFQHTLTCHKNSGSYVLLVIWWRVLPSSFNFIFADPLSTYSDVSQEQCLRHFACDLMTCFSSWYGPRCWSQVLNMTYLSINMSTRKDR